MNSLSGNVTNLSGFWVTKELYFWKTLNTCLHQWWRPFISQLIILYFTYRAIGWGRWTLVGRCLAAASGCGIRLPAEGDNSHLVQDRHPWPCDPSCGVLRLHLIFLPFYICVRVCMEVFGPPLKNGLHWKKSWSRRVESLCPFVKCFFNRIYLRATSKKKCMHYVLSRWGFRGY